MRLIVWIPGFVSVVTTAPALGTPHVSGLIRVADRLVVVVDVVHEAANAIRLSAALVASDASGLTLRVKRAVQMFIWV